MTVVLYFLLIQESVDVEINFSNCGVRENQIKKLLDILANKKGKLHITELVLSGSRLTVSSLHALQSAVGSDLFAKLELLNLSGSLTSDAGINAEWLTTFVDALSAHCLLLSDLDLSDNNLGIPGASALSRIFVTNYSLCGEPSDHTCRLLKYIQLNRANIGDEGLAVWIKDLNVIILYNLALKGNNIHSFGVSCLADAVHSGKLKLVYGKLHLSDNPLGLEGSLAVGTILSSSHCQCFNVDLSGCELTTAGAGLPNRDTVSVGHPTSSEAVTDIGQQLCLMPQSSTIHYLGLDSNSFTGEGSHILAGFIHLCPCLRYLDTSDCGITSDDLIHLLD